MSIYSEIATLFDEQGGNLYFGEAVTEREHALQAAALAEAERAGTALVIAALLHDIGHLLHNQGEDVARRGIDARHEVVGDAFLTAHFGPEVTEPARLHVAAKRYLCAVDEEYAATLSPASVQSLALQGGPMTPGEIAAFEENPYYRDAVRLRRWDDSAKRVGHVVPEIAHYRDRIEELAARHAQS